MVCRFTRPTSPKKYSPLRPTGDGIQSVYLAHVKKDMAAVITRLLDGQLESIIHGAVQEDNPIVSTHGFNPNLDCEAVINCATALG
jgi:hypothetical protein